MAITTTEHIQNVVAVASGGSPVDFDFSMIVMIGLFLTLMVYFNAVLYRPYLRSREVRGQRIEGAKKDARSMQKQAEAVFGAYGDKLALALREASGQRSKVREEAKREEGKILAAARAEMDAVLEGAQADLEAELAQARTTLEREAKSLSAIIVERVLA